VIWPRQQMKSQLLLLAVALLALSTYLCTPALGAERNRRTEAQAESDLFAADEDRSAAAAFSVDGHGIPTKFPAAGLTTQSIKAFSMHSGSTLVNNGESQSDLITDRPLTVPAVPLEGTDGVGLSGSISGSRSRSSLTGSLSSSSHIGSLASHSQHDECSSDSPCGGGGPPKNVRLVKRLTGGGKRFKRIVGKGIWSFGGGTRDHTAVHHAPRGVSKAQIQQLQASDPVLAKLYTQLESLKTKIHKDKEWVKAAQILVRNYQAKAGAVTSSLRSETNQLKALRKAIESRKKTAARQVLGARLKKVHDKLAQLKSATSNVSGEASNLMRLKRGLQENIRAIQREILSVRHSAK